MAYYIGQIIIRNGEYEHIETVCFEESEYSPDTVLFNHCEYYAGDTPTSREDGGFWFGDLFVKPGEAKEITKDAYDQLTLIPDIA